MIEFGRKRFGSKTADTQADGLAPEIKVPINQLNDEEHAIQKNSSKSDTLIKKEYKKEDNLLNEIEHVSMVKSVNNKLLNKLRASLLKQIDITAAAKLNRTDLQKQVESIIGDIASAVNIQLNTREQKELTQIIVDDMVGLGPLEPLLEDESINDILVNGPDKVYVEKKGKLILTDVKFRDNEHVTNIGQRIATSIGRRIDETVPMVDARLKDGSRVNIIMPPLSLTGTTISIRKFSKKKITLEQMVQQGNISESIAQVLKIAAACRLNIIVSGGTGSGKTTLLNAMSRLIDVTERIVTIEDAAELQLQQPHVVSLETRPPNLEGEGEITIRDLVKNSLRMRPDRIIIGEVRGAEVLDMLQAMNTGHDGSMSTIHANQPRDTIMRLENMASMAFANFSPEVVRTQIASAVNLIVQVDRMRDGVRRVTHLTEIVGMESGIITMQDLIVYKYEGERTDGLLQGQFVVNSLKPHFAPRAKYYGLEEALHQAMVTT